MQRPRHQTTRSTLWVFMGLLLFGAARPAAAHDLDVTQTLVVFKTDGTYLIDIRMHLDALALGKSETTSENVVDALNGMTSVELQKTVDDLANMLSHRIRIRFDDIKQRPGPTFPEFRTTLAASSPEPTVLGTTVRFEERVPENAKTFRIGLSRAFGMTQVTIVEEGSGVVVKHLLTAGEDSPTFTFGGAPSPANAAAWRETLGRYIIAGFEHIIPLGIDHILFVLGLFLLSTKLSTLLWQVSAFTIAHTISLGLAMAGIVTLPAGIVEPLIALSIAYVAIENVATKNMKPWRPFVVFAFGLLHGLGFAGVFMKLGFPAGQFATALVGFNFGVEFGQLAVLVMAFLAVGWFRKKDWYRAAIVVPQSLLIAAVGLYWTVERIAAAA